jgi:hypothetical protein
VSYKKEGPTRLFLTRKLRLRWGEGWGTRKAKADPSAQNGEPRDEAQKTAR